MVNEADIRLELLRNHIKTDPCHWLCVVVIPNMIICM